MEYVFFKIYEFFANLDMTSVLSNFGEFMRAITPYSIFISLLLIIGIIYSVLGEKKIRMLEKKSFEDVEKEIENKPLGKSKRWEKVLTHVGSMNQSDWKQAIIEADIMLEELLTELGYQGDGVGEKLKALNSAIFPQLDEAWEAHKVRNVIAHEGSDYVLSQHEARRVVELYHKVFSEHHYI